MMTYLSDEQLEGIEDEPERTIMIDEDTARQLWVCLAHCYVDHLDYPLVHILLQNILKTYEFPR